MTHRAILVDHLDTGLQTISMLNEVEMIRAYAPGHRDLLARGQTIRLANQLHCDMQAFVNANRTLPQAMTRPPLPANLAARRAGLPQLKRA